MQRTRSGRAAGRGPTRRIRHFAFDASKLSRARLFAGSRVDHGRNGSESA